MKGRDVVNWMKANPGVVIPFLAFVVGIILGATVF